MNMLSVLASAALLGILTAGFADLYVATQHQQAAIQRAAAWHNLTTNVDRVLNNATSCTYTLQSFAKGQGSVRDASNTAFTVLGDALAPHMTVTLITATTMGGPLNKTDDGKGNCTIPGNGGQKNGCPAAWEWQTILTVAATYAPLHKQSTIQYVVNVITDNSGHVMACAN